MRFGSWIGSVQLDIEASMDRFYCFQSIIALHRGRFGPTPGADGYEPYPPSIGRLPRRSWFKVLLIF
jgi:hypothetical protein